MVSVGEITFEYSTFAQAKECVERDLQTFLGYAQEESTAVFVLHERATGLIYSKLKPFLQKYTVEEMALSVLSHLSLAVDPNVEESIADT